MINLAVKQSHTPSSAVNHYPRAAQVPARSASAGLAAVGGSRQLPDAGLWGANLARACIEAILCKRDASQLARWLTPELHAVIVRRAGLHHRLKGVSAAPVNVVGYHSFQLPTGEYELSVTVYDGHRARAVALRLEAYRSRWLVTALEIG